MKENFSVSPSYQPPNQRPDPVAITTHIFQDSFPALGTNNGIGGSATVHAQQALCMKEQSVMVAPTENSLTNLKIPAVGFRFQGSSSINHDEWFERPNREFVASVIEDISSKHDPIYSHMPISGAIGAMVNESRGNPHVYLGHAWEYLSGEYFPERGMKPLRLLTEYEMVRNANVIVTNTQWEANAVAELYSDLPSEPGPRKILQSCGYSPEQIKLFSSLINRDSAPLLSRADILAKCVSNPLGVDTSIFNPARRLQLRETLRSAFLADHHWPEDTILLGSVGRIHPQKDPVAAIEVFQKVWRSLGEPTNLRLILAGPHSIDERGSATGHYKEVLDVLNNEHSAIKKYVLFPRGEDNKGTVKADEMNSCLDIRIDTSRFETFGLSLVEALASGLPTVALSNPVYEELYGDGKIIISNTKDELTAQICRLIKDPSCRDKYSEECSKTGGRFSWEYSVDELKKNVLKNFGIL